MERRSIALIGLSGTGKSTVGRLLARRLGWPLLDTDALVVQAAGQSIADLFASRGEEVFRDHESAALRTALAQSPCVIATGGGIVLRDENRDLLVRSARLVWLDATTATLVARLRFHDEERPLLAGDFAARLERLRGERAGLYAALADLRLPTDGQTAEQLCQAILDSVTGA